MGKWEPAVHGESYEAFKEAVVSLRRLTGEEDAARAFFELLERSEDNAAWSPCAGVAVFLCDWGDLGWSVEQAYVPRGRMAEWLDACDGDSWTCDFLAAFDSMSAVSWELDGVDGFDPVWRGIVAGIAGICTLPDWTSEPEPRLLAAAGGDGAGAAELAGLCYERHPDLVERIVEASRFSPAITQRVTRENCVLLESGGSGGSVGTVVFQVNGLGFYIDFESGAAGRATSYDAR